MIKTQHVRYKIFFFERVKKKLRFFNTETYPLQIRLTAGNRSIYIKSKFLALMQRSKYQQAFVNNYKAISINDIIVLEESLVQYLLHTKSGPVSLEALRQEYQFLSTDLLDALDEQFKLFLIEFFFEEDLPAYALFIKNDGINHSSRFILQNMEKSLHPAVFEKLLAIAAAKAPPYIPFVQFADEYNTNMLPVFPAYYWLQDKTTETFNAFICAKFPQYEQRNPLAYISGLMKNEYKEDDFTYSAG